MQWCMWSVGKNIPSIVYALYWLCFSVCLSWLMMYSVLCHALCTPSYNFVGMIFTLYMTIVNGVGLTVADSTIKNMLLLLLFWCRKRQCEHHRRCPTRSSTTFSWPSNSPSNSSSNSSHRQPPPRRCSRPSPRQVFRCNSPRCRCSNQCRCSSRWSASLPSQCSRLWRRQHLCSNRLPPCSYQVSMQAIWFGVCLGGADVLHSVHLLVPARMCIGFHSFHFSVIVI